MKRSKRLFISGAVQPVFFNQFVRENAEKLKLKGFVRKREDGRAEIFVEGDHEALEEMISICKKGPKHSMIKKVEEQDEKFQDFKDFRILSF